MARSISITVYPSELGAEYLTVSDARTALLTIERQELDIEAATVDYRRTEYGAVEVIVLGLTRWYDKKALFVLERLSERKIILRSDRRLGKTFGAKTQI
jgi:hypothetical protein